MTHEKRTHAGVVEVRAREAALPMLRGYAALFNSEAVIGGAFREVILPGAFADVVQRDDVRAQWEHGQGGALPLGRTSAGTLRLGEDKIGLWYEIDLPDTTQARDLAVSVGRGDVAESSFMFDVNDSAGDTEWDYSATKSGLLPLRQIKRVNTLYDVSPVVFPAYADTSVSARALDLAAVRETPKPDTSLAESLALALALDEEA